ncbi:MAG: hypothetical protein WA405_10715 [Candidatus Acidiferrales bacterium]
MKSSRLLLATAAILAMLAPPIPIGAQDQTSKKAKLEARVEKAASLPPVIWQDSDPATLDLFYGPGGKDQAPDPIGTYTFVAEDLKQTQPKFDVKDAQGTRWRVKLGEEAQPEVAAARLLWAAGYYVDQDYYFDQFKVEGLPKLHRGEKYVSAGGVVRGARLKLKSKEYKKLGDWSWFKNPFVGTTQLNGLRVMMALVNNWDLTANNNAIYPINGQREYVVSDIGASFGSTGDVFGRSKGKLGDYEKTKFIAKTSPQYVDLVMHSRPFFLTAVDVPNYQARAHIEDITKHIPRADAKWLGQRLALLSEDQIHDCFRAAGYSPEQIDAYTKIVQERIAELNAL